MLRGDHRQARLVGTAHRQQQVEVEHTGKPEHHHRRQQHEAREEQRRAGERAGHPAEAPPGQLPPIAWIRVTAATCRSTIACASAWRALSAVAWAVMTSV